MVSPLLTKCPFPQFQLPTVLQMTLVASSPLDSPAATTRPWTVSKSLHPLTGSSGCPLNSLSMVCLEPSGEKLNKKAHSLGKKQSRLFRIQILARNSNPILPQTGQTFYRIAFHFTISSNIPKLTHYKFNALHKPSKSASHHIHDVLGHHSIYLPIVVDNRLGSLEIQ